MGPEEIAAVLEAHNYQDDTSRIGDWAMQCGCGWKAYRTGAQGSLYACRAAHDQHRAEVLAALLVARIERAEAGAERATNMAREANAVAIKHWNRADKAEAQLITARDALAAIEAYAEAERVRANEAEAALDELRVVNADIAAERDRAKADTFELDDLRAKVAALADEWDGSIPIQADDLRALLGDA